MVVDLVSTERTDLIFHALSDRTRRDILALALAGEHSVSDLARRFPMSFAAVQKHVAVLDRAGLVVKQQRGREQRVTADPGVLREAHRVLDALEQTWRGRVDRIDDLLTEPSTTHEE